jgi:hypothetical protein
MQQQKEVPMSFTMMIGPVPTFFTKVKRPPHVPEVLEFVESYAQSKYVVFIDISPNRYLFEAVKHLTKGGYEVTVITHHDFVGEPRNENERHLRATAEDLRGLLKDRARITNRQEFPSSLQLLKAGECRRAVIIADGDADGLSAAMYGADVHSYNQLPADAALFDAAPERKLSVSPVGLLLIKSLALTVDEKQKREVFNSWLLASQGDDEARDSLEVRFPQWEATANQAAELARRAKDIFPGVFLADAVFKPRYDLNTLAQIFEQRGASLFVVRQSFGPVAFATCDVNYRMHAIQSAPDRLDVQDLLPPGYDNSPKEGIMAHGSFLLWVSERIWQETILPALHQRFRKG